MKILITGGAGFCGSHLTDRLVERGHDVTVLGRGNDRLLNKKARFIKRDVRAALSGVFKNGRFDAVFHLAAQNAVWRSINEPLYDCRINIEGGLNVIEQCKRYGVKKIIYSSAAGAVYGEAKRLPVSEKDPPNPISPYGISKYTVEKYLRMYGNNYGLKFTILRYPSVYGPRQVSKGGANIVSILSECILKGTKISIYGDGKQGRDFVYIGDIVDATELALFKGDCGTYNLASGRSASILEIIALIGRITGKKADVTFEPARVGEVKNIYFETGHAKKELGWQAKISLEEGLRRTLDGVKAI